MGRRTRQDSLFRSPNLRLNRQSDGRVRGGTMIENGGYIRDLLRGEAGKSAVAHGWVKTRRDGKGLHFVQINDGSCFADLQVVIEADVIPEETLKHVTTGACVRVTGDL